MWIFICSLNIFHNIFNYSENIYVCIFFSQNIFYVIFSANIFSRNVFSGYDLASLSKTAWLRYVTFGHIIAWLRMWHLTSCSVKEQHDLHLLFQCFGDGIWSGTFGSITPSVFGTVDFIFLDILTKPQLSSHNPNGYRVLTHLFPPFQHLLSERLRLSA